MKVCFVTHKVVKGDGQGRVNYEVIAEAIRQGHEIAVVASEIADELRGHPAVSWHRIDTGRLPSNLLRYQAFAWLAALWLWKNGRELDAVVVNGFITYARSDLNCVHFVHSAWLQSPYHPFRQRRSLRSFYHYLYNGLNAKLERMAFRRTRRVIAVSEQVKRELMAYAGVPEDRISVITNGVDLQEFYPKPVSRAEHRLPEDAVLALFAGDIKSSRKNLDTVLRSLQAVPGVHLLVLGSTDGSPYPRMAKELGLGDRIRFLGYRRDVADMMSLCDVFVYPSRYEPFSLVLLEAMATGLPVITSSRCGAVELLTQEAGIVVEDPDDAESLAAALQSVIADRERLKRMGAAASRLARDHTWQAMADRYLGIIHQFNPVRAHG